MTWVDITKGMLAYYLAKNGLYFIVHGTGIVVFMVNENMRKDYIHDRGTLGAWARKANNILKEDKENEKDRHIGYVIKGFKQD